MSCHCDDLAYGALLSLPGEVKPILGPFDRDFALTDLVFDLYTFPEGDTSRAYPLVWNTLPGAWSRLLVGGTVTETGLQYHLESGIVCPTGSTLYISAGWYVARPTALVSARVSGCFCERGHRHHHRQQPALRFEWEDGGEAGLLSVPDPTGRPQRQLLPREALGSAVEEVPCGDLRLLGSGDDRPLLPGTTRAFRLTRPTWRWSSEGLGVRTGRAPAGTTLVVARRSADGRTVHWAMYREAVPSGGRRRPSRKGR